MNIKENYTGFIVGDLFEFESDDYGTLAISKIM